MGYIKPDRALGAVLRTRHVGRGGPEAPTSQTQFAGIRRPLAELPPSPRIVANSCVMPARMVRLRAIGSIKS